MGLTLVVSGELDREEAAFKERKDRGLGLMGTWHEVENRYGGCIQQQVRLEQGRKKGDSSTG